MQLVLLDLVHFSTQIVYIESAVVTVPDEARVIIKLGWQWKSIPSFPLEFVNFNGLVFWWSQRVLEVCDSYLRDRLRYLQFLHKAHQLSFLEYVHAGDTARPAVRDLHADALIGLDVPLLNFEGIALDPC